MYMDKKQTRNIRGLTEWNQSYVLPHLITRYIDSISHLNRLDDLMFSAEERGEDQCNMKHGADG